MLLGGKGGVWSWPELFDRPFPAALGDVKEEKEGERPTRPTRGKMKTLNVARRGGGLGLESRLVNAKTGSSKKIGKGFWPSEQRSRPIRGRRIVASLKRKG